MDKEGNIRASYAVIALAEAKIDDRVCQGYIGEKHIDRLDKRKCCTGG